WPKSPTRPGNIAGAAPPRVAKPRARIPIGPGIDSRSPLPPVHSHGQRRTPGPYPRPGATPSGPAVDVLRTHLPVDPGSRACQQPTARLPESCVTVANYRLPRFILLRFLNDRYWEAAR